ncbi:MAG TPA: hypothetical protein PKW55_03725 [Spirochaetota bacterium]|nr:hypothetical protein [Spirochaetota bacterium]HOM38056.1 hypothetical protein [Spirochaetota bacterium]HPQ48860.1 hypothetical protein [Spirochaetota bacterium]
MKILNKVLTIIVLNICILSFSQVLNDDSKKVEEYKKLYRIINEKLLNLKLSKDYPSDYNNIWSININKIDFSSLEKTNISTYNNLVVIKNEYNSLKEDIEKRYPNTISMKIEKEKKDELEKIPPELMKELNSKVGASRVNQFKDMFVFPDFLNKDFSGVEYFAKRPKILQSIVEIQKKYQEKINSINEKYSKITPSSYLQDRINELDGLKIKDLDKLEKSFKQDMRKSLGATAIKQIGENITLNDYLAKDFNSIDYFVKRPKVLESAEKLRKDYKEKLEAIERDYQLQKQTIEMIKRKIDEINESEAEIAKEYDEKLAKEIAKKNSKGGFWYNFWIGLKTGVNYSTGSEAKSAEAAPGFGLVTEYTIMDISEIAFEGSIEMNINYIQKPVVIEEGKINSDYINIPVFAKGKWPANIPLGFGTLTPFIGIGVDPYLRLTSNFEPNNIPGGPYLFDTKGFNVGFVWSLGGELNILGIGTATLEFRMSLGASSGISGYTVPLSRLGYNDVYVPEQKQNGYMIFAGFKMSFGHLFDLF